MALFRNEPRLAPTLLEAIGHRLPAAEVELGSADLSELLPTERRADLVLHLRGPTGREPSLVLEVQRAADEDKRYSWPQYLCSLRAVLRRDVLLVVVTLDRDVARWAGRTIETGHPGFSLTPLVVGPDAVPRITKAAEAAALPELAVLSALAHLGEADTLALAVTALQSTASLDTPRADMYVDIVLWALRVAAPEILEALMQQPYVFKSDLARHNYAQGREEGLAEGLAEGREEGREEGQRRLLRQLARRYGPLPDWVEPLIRAASPDELDRWAEQIFDAPNLEGLLGRAI